jgi:hypothetical protein
MNISRVGDTSFLSGVIDEEADFSLILKEPQPANLDFSGIERVNSIGLRSWMHFMSKWGDKPLNYLNCPVSIGDHLATLPALGGIPKRVAVALSAMIPYDCLKCNHSEDFMVKQAEVIPEVLPRVLSPKCRICSGDMELLNPDQLAIFAPRS